MYYIHGMSDSTLIPFRAPEETVKILDALTEAEGRTRSDIIRRALHFYGEAAGVVQARPKRKSKVVKVSKPVPRPKRVKGG